MQTKSEKIWEEIKDKQVEMFSLPAQPVQKYAQMHLIDHNKLHLTSTIPALLPTLEVALAPKYKVELVDKFIVISSAE